MAPTALALLVVVWYGHDIPPKQMDVGECQVAAATVRQAAIVSNKLYATDTDISAYCLLLGTGADEVVAELLATPRPSPRPQSVRIVPPPP